MGLHAMLFRKVHERQHFMLAAVHHGGELRQPVAQLIRDDPSEAKVTLRRNQRSPCRGIRTD